MIFFFSIVIFFSVIFFLLAVDFLPKKIVRGSKFSRGPNFGQKSTIFGPKSDFGRKSSPGGQNRPQGLGKDIILTSQTVKKRVKIQGTDTNEQPKSLHPFFDQKTGRRRAKSWHKIDIFGGQNRRFLTRF